MNLLVPLRLSQVIALTGALATLVVNPWSNYDPISLPKMVVMSGGAISAAAFLIFNQVTFFATVDRSTKFAFSVFLIGLMVPMLFSGAPLAQQFWGSFGRNTGLLTYLSLASLMFATLVLRSTTAYSIILRLFIGTAAPMTAYCLVQYFHKDPISWSEKFVFGTLGNVNFLSAFICMTSVAFICLATSKNISIKFRIAYLLIAFLDVLIAASTKSIQGPVIFSVGIGLIPLFKLLGRVKKNYLVISGYLSLLLIGFIGLALGVVNKGPLAKVIFQPSILFRADYMHAGWSMFTTHPLTGVGMDSYGDWYRQVRGEISTLRTGPGRTSNTAHNIFLDVASNGGIVIAIGYLLLILLTLISIMRIVRSGKIRNTFVLAFVVTWLAYEVQALVSINQIGVGIWGWILGGAIIGIDKGLELEEIEKWRLLSDKMTKLKTRGKTLPASQFLVSAAGFAIGIAIAAPPWLADVAYRASSTTGNFQKIYSATQRLGSTQQHQELLLDLTMRNNLANEALQVASRLVDEYPRNFFGWRVLSVASANTPDGRAKAAERAQALDPFNPELKP